MKNLMILTLAILIGCSGAQNSLSANIGLSICPSFRESAVFKFADSNMSVVIFSDFRISKEVDTLYYVARPIQIKDSVEMMFNGFSAKPNNFIEEEGVFDGCRVTGFSINMNNKFDEQFNYKAVGKSDTVQNNLGQLHGLLYNLWSTDSVVVGYLNDSHICDCFAVKDSDINLSRSINILRNKRYLELNSASKESRQLLQLNLKL